MIAAILFFGVLLPPGLVAVRLARIEATPLLRLAMALGFGFSMVLALLLLELQMGGPWLLLPTVAIAIGVSRPSLRQVTHLRGIAPDLIVAVLLACLALWVNAGDLRFGPGGVSARVGFDVSDRTLYAMVAQELERAPVQRMQNPAFAGMPLHYSYFPSLAAILLHRYAGVPLLQACTTYLPALGLGLTGLMTCALAQSLGARGWVTRSLSALLVALGGDLSFLVPHVNDSWLERARHFYVFYSYSGEVLFYNPWAFGLPLAMATILWASGYCKVGSGMSLLAAATVTAALFETKAFAFLPLWLAVACLGLTGRDRRLLALAGASLALVSPALFLTLGRGDPRESAPLLLGPLAFVKDAVAANPTLSTIAAHAGLAATAVLILAAGFGLRLVGLPRLLQLIATHTEARLAAVAMVIATALALCLRGNPTRLDGAQFLVLPQALLWLFAAPAVHAISRRGLASRLLGGVFVVAAAVSPLRYIAMKRFPEFLTTPGSMDRLRFTLSPSTVEACKWLSVHSRPAETLVLPLVGDLENRGGLKPLYVAAIAERRIAGQGVPYLVAPNIVMERNTAIERLYSTRDPAEGERILAGLGATWVWVDAARPLRFRSARLEWQANFGPTTLLRLAPEEEAGARSGSLADKTVRP